MRLLTIVVKVMEQNFVKLFTFANNWGGAGAAICTWYTANNQVSNPRSASMINARRKKFDKILNAMCTTVKLTLPKQ